MNERVGYEQLLGMLLQRTPDRVIDAIAAVSPEDAKDIPAIREALALAALSADPVRPSDELRRRLLAAKPRPLRPKRPVVIVLDMIQDHLTEGKPLEVPRARAIVPVLRDHLNEWRKEKLPIIFVCDTHPADDPDFRDWPHHAIEGTAGADPVPELGPEPGEIIIRKKTYSAFTGSKLDETLAGLGADKIILTGCLTEIGLQITASDALQRGYVVTVPADCQAGTGELIEKATLLTLSTMPPYDPIYLRKSVSSART